MQREIKFRAWSKVNKTMSPPVTLNQLITAFVKGGWELDGSLELFQYTGLKDKNGKEIYEGDIVQWQEDKCEVRFYGGSFCINPMIFWKEQIGTELGQDSPWNWRYLVELCEECEVIGNIYENPELLK